MVRERERSRRDGVREFTCAYSSGARGRERIAEAFVDVPGAGGGGTGVIVGQAIRRHRRLRESKIVKKEKKEKKRQKSSRDDVDEDALRRLREERIAREQRESARERALTGSGRPNDDEYRSGYGYQPRNKRPSNRRRIEY